MKRQKIAFTLCVAFAAMLLSSAAFAQYKLTNLVSNQVGWAKHIDPLQVNGWGLVYGPGGPFWVSDQGSGWSTLYTGQGIKKSLEVLIPSASGAGPGQPTGIVVNGSSDFQIGGWNSIFLFATLDGTISGWAPQTNPNDAIIVVNNSATGAQYTGLAISSKASGNFLYAADLANNKVDMYDGSFNLVTSFTDPTLPGYAPFGIQDLGGFVYVAFAQPDEAPGGFIDIFQEDGTFVRQLAGGGPLNQPWGFAVAPKNFGKLSNTLLVSNNTNAGTINGFNLESGEFVGAVKDTNGKEIVINQLWGIEFGGGTANNGRTNQLFFTAGPANNLAGTFGVIALP
jgi:uncharacterized protein (TIGR03118 family)